MAKAKKSDIAALLDTTPETPAPDSGSSPPQFSAEVQQALAGLSTKYAKLVTNVAAGMLIADAAMDAGFAGTRQVAGSAAARVLRENESVKDALNLIKADLAARAEYKFDKFIAELDEAIAFAIKTENATAYVRAVELKGKASGHIVDRVDQRNLNAGFQLMVAGVEPPKAPNG